MDKELRELLNDLEAAQISAKDIMEKEDATVEEINAATNKIKAIKARIDAIKEIDSEPDGGEPIADPVNKIDINKAFVNALRGRATPAEIALLNTGPVETTGLVKDDSGNQDKGGYIVPPDYDAKIREYMREYKAAKPLMGYYKTNVTSGSMIYEDLSTITPMTPMAEFTQIDRVAPKFSKIDYAVQDFGALLPISNTLLQDEQGGLMDYIGRWFAKKDVRTANTEIFDALLEATKADGSSALVIEEFDDWLELKSGINTMIDPLVSANSIIITNQDGFDILDSLLDGTGKPILQPDVADPSVRRFMGRIVHVFANVELANLKLSGTTWSVPANQSGVTHAPIIFGAMTEAVKYIDRGVFEMASSKDYGFGYNATYIRCIDRFDVQVADKDAYVYGGIKLEGGDA